MAVEQNYSKILSYQITPIDPIDYDLLVQGKQGAFSNNLGGMVQYLKACRLISYRGNFYQFDGCIYHPISDEDVSNELHRAVDTYTDKACLKEVVLRASEIRDVIAKLHAVCDLSLLPCDDLSDYYSIENSDEFGVDPRDNFDHLIPFNNGLYNIQTDTLLPFTPALFITHKLKVNYDPTITECPEAEAIFNRMFTSPETLRCLFQMVGYTMYAQRITPKDASLFILYGPGANGKGTLQTILTKIIGKEFCSSLDISQVTATFTSNKLDGMIANFCADASGQSSKVTKIDSGILKCLATGETVTVQKKHEKPIEMTNNAKLWFMANSQPDLGGVDGGVLRRLFIIHMTTTFSKDEHIQEILYSKKAVQWFANKALDAYCDFLQAESNFAITEEMENERKFYARSNNIFDFLYATYSEDLSEIQRMISGIDSKSLYATYKMYCADTGTPAFKSRNFNETLHNDFGMTLELENYYTNDGRRTSRNIWTPTKEVEEKKGIKKPKKE